MGLPGAIGSVDGVHIPCVALVCLSCALHPNTEPPTLRTVRWERAPSGTCSWYIGKSGIPTVQFNVTCSRSGDIIHVSELMPGSQNDKTAAHFDRLMQDVRDGNGAYGRMKWAYHDAGGSVKVAKGAWLVCDAGYHQSVRLSTHARCDIDIIILIISQ